MCHLVGHLARYANQHGRSEANPRLAWVVQEPLCPLRDQHTGSRIRLPPCGSVLPLRGHSGESQALLVAPTMAEKIRSCVVVGTLK